MLVLDGYHILVWQPRVCPSPHILELSRFSSCSVSILYYASVLSLMERYIISVWHQSHVTLTGFSTKVYCLEWACTSIYLWLSHFHFAEQSMVYCLKYSNLCIPPGIVMYAFLPISISWCVEFILHTYRIYHRKYMVWYSYCTMLCSTNLYNAIINTSLSSHLTSYIVHCIHSFGSIHYCPVLPCVDQYPYVYWIHSIYSQSFAQNKYKFSHTSCFCTVLLYAHVHSL